MRVLHVISSPTFTRGVARQLSALMAGMTRHEGVSHLCILRQRKSARDLTVEALGPAVSIVESRGVCGLFAARTLRREIDAFQPDLIHIWDDAVLVLIRLATLGETARLIMQLSVDKPASFLDWLVSQRSLPSVERFVASTLDGRQRAGERGCAPAKVTVIPLGVDVESPPVPSREEFLREFGLPESARCVAVVGRLLLRKRHKDLIWAADMLKFYGLELHVLLFGEGQQRWRLERYARQCQVDDRIHFLGERADVRRWLPRCDLLWQANETAGTGVAILEAMAAGIPVVASDIPAHRELVVPGQTGLLVRLGARADFAEAANRLIKDSDLTRRLGEAGRERVRAKFTTEKIVERFLSLYRDVLGLRG